MLPSRVEGCLGWAGEGLGALRCHTGPETDQGDEHLLVGPSGGLDLARGGSPGLQAFGPTSEHR